MIDQTGTQPLTLGHDDKYAYALFCAELLDILSAEGGIQRMVDSAYQAFGNPVCVFDACYSLIAANWEESKKLDLNADTLALMERKGFSDKEFEMANSRDHIHKRLQKSELPIHAYNPDAGCDQLLCTIDTHKDLGHIVVSAINHPLRPVDTQLLLALKKAIGEHLKKDEFIQTIRGFNYESFLKELLDEKITISKSFLDRSKRVFRDFDGNLYCMVVETDRGSNTVNLYHVRNVLESIAPNVKTLIYHGQVIAVFCLPKDQFLPRSQLDSVVQLCRENDLCAGLSSCFLEIFNFSAYYKQALRAVELGSCTTAHPGLFLYSEYSMAHVASVFMQKESVNTFCHPKLKLLMDYDEKSGSELAYTLYMYLICERNIATTAVQMHMHRNSLVYRIKKIVSLIGDDLDDYHERQYLTLSYEMVRQAKSAALDRATLQ